MAFRRVDEEMVLVSSGRGTIFTLNEVGAHVWDQIDGARTVDDLVQGVCERFEVDETAARSDVSTFLADLAELGLVRGTEASAG